MSKQEFIVKMRDLNIATYNVNGIRDNQKRTAIYKYLRRKNLDIIFFQETHATRNDEYYWRSSWGGRMYFSNGSSSSKGVAIMFKRDSDIKIKQKVIDQEGRYILLTVICEGKSYTLVNIYGPNEDNPDFYTGVARLVENRENLIVAGDFNIPLDPDKDKSSPETRDTKKNARIKLQNIMQEHDLVDIWRLQNHHQQIYTWMRNSGQDMSWSRIDFFLISSPLVNTASYTDILPSFKSDHSIPILRIGSLRHSCARFYSENQLHWTDKTKILGIVFGSMVQRTVEINTEIILNKLEKILSNWATRSLTVIGRILVINTLAVSSMVHILSILPILPDSFFTKVKKMFTEYIWQGKRAKIAYSKLILKIPDGGLKLVDPYAKQLALKISWIRKSVDGENFFWKIILQEIMPLPLSQIWSANIKIKDINSILPINSIGKDLWKTWAKFNYVETQYSNPEEIFNQQIWLNTNIRVNKQVIIKNSIRNLAITQIKEIYRADSSRFYTIEEICQEYGTNFIYLEYLSILEAIPSYWKDRLKNRTQIQDINSGIDILCQKTSPSKYAYNTLITQLTPPTDPVCDIWEREYGIIIPIESWHDHRMYSYYLLLSTKQKWFQYRVLSRRIVTNVTRHKWNLIDNNRCHFCNVLPETMNHLFITCKHVKRIWTAMFRWLEYILELKLDLSHDVMMLANYVGQFKDFVNLVLIFVKQYIYDTKCCDGKLNFMQLSSKLHRLYLDEKAIAQEENNVPKFVKKWSIYMRL